MGIVGGGADGDERTEKERDNSNRRVAGVVGVFYMST